MPRTRGSRVGESARECAPSRERSAAICCSDRRRPRGFGLGCVVVQGKLIDILSDSTGETAEKVVRAAMLQFPHSGAQIRMHTRVRTKEAARPVLERAAQEGALVVFTVVSPELREFIHVASYELKVEALDLIGSLIGKLTTFLDRAADQHAERHAPAQRRVLPPHRGGRVHGEERRRQGAAQLQEGGPRPRRREPHVEDAALDAARAARAQGREPPDRARRPARRPSWTRRSRSASSASTIGLDPLVEIRKARLKQLGMSVDASYGLTRSSEGRARVRAQHLREHPQLARHRRHRARDRRDRGDHPRVAQGARRQQERCARRSSSRGGATFRGRAPRARRR